MFLASDLQLYSWKIIDQGDMPFCNWKLWRTFSRDNSSDKMVDVRLPDVIEEPRLLEHVVQPSYEHVREVLPLLGHNSLSNLIATYFEYSAHASRLCVLLIHSIHRARLMYTTLHKLLDDLPLESDSLSYSRFNLEGAILEFGRFENPFHSPDAQSFGDMLNHFSQLKQQLNQHFRKSRFKLNLTRHCFKEMSHQAVIDTTAARNVYVLCMNLATIDRMMSRLHEAFELDKLLSRLGLERVMDRYVLEEVLKQLRKNSHSFSLQLVELEESLCLCLATINRGRTQLLQQIQVS
ncbi:UPF0496 protein At3g19330-like isoform X2 [Andrographis paniculata]|uniref:UPF0496 protein At3g19330-like isoform X2 n=1 Tax=Andrographis paniculata TaxID=175694 RepID=UPI0021E775E4|nr:UPF0496 protein At3g19330-like isoform X2 [Andrographis paniculata]